MSAESSEVRGLLSVLGEKVSTCREALSAQHVGNALYGLQCMSAESSEVRGLVSVLGEKVSTCREALNAQEVGNALYGLQCMSTESSEVRGLLSVLAEKVSTCREALNAQHVGNALYGLQGMNPECFDAFTIRDVICGKLADSRFLGNDLIECNQIILGLCAYPTTDSTTKLIKKMMHDLKDAAAASTSLENEMPLVASLRLLVGLELPLFMSLPTDVKAEVESVLALMVSRKRAGAAIHTANASERFYGRLAMKALTGYREEELIIRVARNADMYDFEADLVVTIEPAANAQQHPPLVMNFEIDGPTHALATKRRYCAMRDRYLALHGVVVKRIDIVKYEQFRMFHELSKAEYAEAVMKGYRMRVDTELMKRGWHLEEVQGGGLDK
jgi:hypothetical protein